jgi:hypothetical protein
VLADVAGRSRAEQRIDDRVQDDVAVGVAEHPRSNGTSTPPSASGRRAPAVHVPALTNADRTADLATARPLRTAAPRQRRPTPATPPHARTGVSTSAFASPTINPSPSDSERNAPELCVPVERAR